MPVIKTSTGESKWVEKSTLYLPKGAPPVLSGFGYIHRITFGLFFAGFIFYKVTANEDSWYGRAANRVSQIFSFHQMSEADKTGIAPEESPFWEAVNEKNKKMMLKQSEAFDAIERAGRWKI